MVCSLPSVAVLVIFSWIVFGPVANAETGFGVPGLSHARAAEQLNELRTIADKTVFHTYLPMSGMDSRYVG